MLNVFFCSTQEHVVPFNYLREPSETSNLDIGLLQLQEELEVFVTTRDNEPAAWWRARVKKKGDTVNDNSFSFFAYSMKCNLKTRKIFELFICCDIFCKRALWVLKVCFSTQSARKVFMVAISKNFGTGRGHSHDGRTE